VVKLIPYKFEPPTFHIRQRSELDDFIYDPETNPINQGVKKVNQNSKT
jgi:hypothetical protein